MSALDINIVGAFIQNNSEKNIANVNTALMKDFSEEVQRMKPKTRSGKIEEHISKKNSDTEFTERCL